MTDSDTLKNADLGDTEQYENTIEWCGFNTVPDELNRRDLTQNLTDAEAEIVTNEYGDQDVKITVEGEVMKTLPRRWESFPREKPTSREDTKQNTLSVILGGIVATGVSALVVSQFNQVLTKITVNGDRLGSETVTISAWDIAAMMLFVFAITVGLYTLGSGVLKARRKA